MVIVVRDAIPRQESGEQQWPERTALSSARLPLTLKRVRAYVHGEIVFLNATRFRHNVTRRCGASSAQASLAVASTGSAFASPPG